MIVSEEVEMGPRLQKGRDHSHYQMYHYFLKKIKTTNVDICWFWLYRRVFYYFLCFPAVLGDFFLQFFFKHQKLVDLQILPMLLLLWVASYTEVFFKVDSFVLLHGFQLFIWVSSVDSPIFIMWNLSPAFYSAAWNFSPSTHSRGWQTLGLTASCHSESPVFHSQIAECLPPNPQLLLETEVKYIKTCQIHWSVAQEMILFLLYPSCFQVCKLYYFPNLPGKSTRSRKILGFMPRKHPPAAPPPGFRQMQLSQYALIGSRRDTEG